MDGSGWELLLMLLINLSDELLIATSVFVILHFNFHVYVVVLCRSLDCDESEKNYKSYLNMLSILPEKYLSMGKYEILHLLNKLTISMFKKKKT